MSQLIANPPAAWATLVQLLRWRATHQPDRSAFTFLGDGEAAETSWTYGELDRQARVVAAQLAELGAAGERALLLYPPGLDFIAGFFGCLYAGVTAVPAYPPRLNRHLNRLQAVVAGSQAVAALTTRSLLARIEPQFAEALDLKALRWAATDALDPARADDWREPAMRGDTVAFLQFTSGSTSDPKGVILTHANLLHNSALIHRGFETTPESRGVFWLPLYHDMGLIGGVIQTVYCGGASTLLSPVLFLQRPWRWLQAISRTRASISGGPNFAYDLCARHIPVEQKAGLDLSTWSLAFTGGEPVRAETLEQFAAAFAECGFRREAFYPCYGLAEATLYVTGGVKAEPPVVRAFQAAALEGNQVVPAAGSATGARQLVGCGRVPPGLTVAIVDPDTRTRCPADRVGEIWIAGPSVSQGYWSRPDDTVQTFQAYLATGEGPFLRSGDLGVLQDGELFVTGRLKDLLIIRGRNHYPQDIELTVEQSHPALRSGGGAAFAVNVAGEDQLAVVQEVHRHFQVSEQDEVIRAIRRAITDNHELQVHAVALLKAGSVPKTSSGKIQRHACREGFLAGTLDVVAEWRKGAATSPPSAESADEPAEGQLPARKEDCSVEIPRPSAGSFNPEPTATAGAPVAAASFNPEPTAMAGATVAVGSGLNEEASQLVVDRASDGPSVEAVQGWLVERLAGRLGIAANEVDVRETFAGFGLKSADAVSMIAELEAWLGQPLSPTLVYDYPTPEAVARHLGAEAAAAESPSPGPLGPEAGSEPIAVIGLGCRFPRANSPDEFWQLLRDGVDAITEVPPDRWDVDAYYDPDPDAPGKMASRWGGFLEAVDQFDASFFGISPREVVSVDPQQRLLLETCWEALENAGLAPARLTGSPTGVFVGISGTDYLRLIDALGPAALDAYSLTGNLSCVAAGRLSYVLGLHGPSLAVDTACSSSLVAAHLACQSLRRGECRTALAAGVNLMLDPTPTISLSKMRALSPEGRCKTFDASADGYVRGEGCGVVVLKRLADALADGDRILALIRGSAVNQDGRTSGLTAPNGPSQEALIRRALDEGGIEPALVSYIEAHGTGTPLGDPIEVQALGAVLSAGRMPSQRLLVGSVKTNIGHLEAAAGVAGLIKVVLALQHGEIPPHLHFHTPSALIPWDGLQVEVPTRPVPWPARDGRRIAGVSSFGFSGTNAHVVVEAPPERDRPVGETERPVHLLTLSAQTGEALRELSGRLERHLAMHPDEPLADVCYTANVGRSAFAHRLAILAESTAQLRARLAAFVAGDPQAEVFTGKVTGANPLKVSFRFTGTEAVGMGQEDTGRLALPVPRGDPDEWQVLLEKLATLYVQGATVDWAALDRDYPQRRKLALPTYPFQRQRYWIPENRHRLPPADGLSGHPLLGKPFRSAASRDVVFENQLAASQPAYLSDHRAGSAVVFPATGYVEMALAAAREVLGNGAITIEQLEIAQPLALPAKGRKTVQLVLTPEEAGRASFQVFSRDGEPSADQVPAWTLHATGRLHLPTEAATPEPVALEELAKVCHEAVALDGYYQDLAARGLAYGPAFRGLVGLSRGEGQALGRVHLPATLRDSAPAYQLHPALLDACLQTVAATLPATDPHAAYLPVGLERLDLLVPPGLDVSCHARVQRQPGAGIQVHRADLTLANAAGRVVAQLRGLTLMRTDRQALERIGRPDLTGWLYEIEWRPQPRAEAAAAPARGPGRWLIFTDATGVGETLAQRLEAAGHHCLRVAAGETYRPLGKDRYQLDPAGPADFARLLSEALSPEGPGLQGVVHLWGLIEGPAGDLEAEQVRSLASTLHLVQALARVRLPRPPRLWLVTRGGQAVGEAEPVEVHQAPVWGLGKVIALEHPELTCVRIDLDPGHPSPECQRRETGTLREPVAGAPGLDADAAVEPLLAELLAPDREDQIAFRGGQRLVARLVPSTARARAAGRLLVPAAPFQLQIPQRGILDNLRLQAVDLRPLEVGEVRVQVRAAGLNFRDVLNALGMYPGDPGPLGGECAGIVTAVGPGVEGFAIGDEVLGFAPASFASAAVTRAELLARKPATLSFEQAATLPITFATASYGLEHLAKLRRGERVLIHAAAGGVGLAAVQLAQAAGADVYATASPPKWDYLKSLGVKHLFNSRTLEFADQVKRATGGRGVDVVLNSLSGDFIPQSLGVLAPGGRFLEIGKRDIWSPERVAQARPDVAYHVIALDQMMAEDPAGLGQVLAALLPRLARGELKPLTHRVYPIQQAMAAFRTMQQAKHVGKIVLAVPPAAVGDLRADATYLVTGGLGALGSQVARWLVEHGARHLVLTGRHQPSDAAAEVVRELEQAGARVAVRLADVSRREDIARLLEEVRASLPPLRGVVHAAGVVDDGVLQQLSWERFTQVLAPKVQGTWNLHTLTREQALDFFVCFSSAASLVGSPGQGNYAAANAFLDALAHRRRAEGLPALSLNWGPWAEAGMAARSRQGPHRWAAQGLKPIHAPEGLQALEQLLRQDLAQAAVLPVQWAAFFRQFPPGQEPPLLSDLARAAQPAGSSAERSDFLERLGQTPPAERHDFLLAHVRAQAAEVLHLDPAQPLDVTKGFLDLGMDSLMAVELKNRLQASLGAAHPLPATLVFDYPTIAALADYLAGAVGGAVPEGAATEAPPAEAERTRILAEVEQLSEQEMAKLIDAELSLFKP